MPPRPHTTPADPAAVTTPAAPQPTPWICRKPVRLSIYAVLAVIFLAMLTWRYLPGILDPTFEEHLKSGKVMVGMTREQVMQAWGSPYTMNVSYTKDGLRREEWIYEDWDDPATVKHRYLYFEENILVGGWYSD